MPDRIRVGVEFEVEPDDELRARGLETPYRDTVWWTEEEYGTGITTAILNRMRAGTDAKTNARKQERHANWKAVVLAPPVEEPEDG